MSESTESTEDTSNIQSIKCFVIMPFSSTTNHSEEYWTRHYTHFLKPIIEECGYIEVMRSEPLRGNIMSDITYNLINADIVVADITDHNPNVFFELGVRQSFRHGTITIAQEDTKIPFDIAPKGVIKYNYDHLNPDEFKNQFQRAIYDCINNPKYTDSIILESISGRGTLYYLIHQNEISRKLFGVLRELKDNKREIEILYTNIEKDKELQLDKRRAPFGQMLQYVCLENLLVDRYLDIDIQTYSDIESCVKVIKLINNATEYLQNKHTYQDGVRILLNKEDEIKARTNGLIDKLLEIYQKT